ncbi:peptidase S41 family protein [Colletotrichum godetiae]|uniref:Peptidase S41 family protein n=1 Tax=Colletotrichum godetiae TaxID=1209918 RepID=A0AAJ0ALU6_9PEZI|nr:peptidase S41 family protein [Colletotrichum godetiae]KAK1676279.1 peptidase S41 family protein [Colletotrichum godetiae]
MMTTVWLVWIHAVTVMAGVRSQKSSSPFENATSALLEAERSSLSTTDPVESPCSSVNTFLLQHRANGPPQVPAKLAYDCLRSVPNKPGPAIDLINSLGSYVKLQSTISWLKSPPPSYKLPAVDIESGLERIRSKVGAGGYLSEYDFQLDILELISAAHDGHFVFRGDVFKVFSFRNSLMNDVVSISQDGVDIPRLYHLGQLQQNTSASAIAKINGRDAKILIEDLNLKYSGLQDPDSQWNSQFKSYATKQNSLVLSVSPVYQGDTINLAYENGEQRVKESFAILRPGVNFTGIRNGEDYYNRFCNPDLPLSNAPADAGNKTRQSRSNSLRVVSPLTAPIDGYPTPQVRDSGINLTSGYFLNGSGYMDVAVLAVSSFAPPEAVDSFAYLNDFQQTVEKFLAASQKAGKTKLVIDVTGNGGGFILAGFDLFAQLFPHVSRFQANNLRLPPSVTTLARLAAAIPANFTPKTLDEQEALSNLRGSPLLSNLLPKGVFTPDKREFKSVEQILHPVSLNGDAFSAYQQIPMDQPDPLFNLTGTGTRTNPPASIFSPENVVLLTDGVRTTVMGGRPQTGIMQSIAGVEGAQLLSFNDLTIDVKSALRLVPESQRNDFEFGDLGELAKGYAIKRSMNPRAAGALNIKNAFALSNAQVPLQFLWEPANCRIFYTIESLSQPEVAWKRAVDVTWNNRTQLCVADSIVSAVKPAAIDPYFLQSA